MSAQYAAAADDLWADLSAATIEAVSALDMRDIEDQSTLCALMAEKFAKLSALLITKPYKSLI